MQSLFDNLKILPEDPILGIGPLFKKDGRKEKVNLGIGTYKDENGNSLVLDAVRKAEEEIEKEHLDKEYQPIDGDIHFKEAVMELVFGDRAKEIQERTAQVATIGGSGSLRLAGDLLNLCKITTAAIPNPSWSNHFGLLKAIPNLVNYTYYDLKKNCIDFSEMLEDLQKLPKGSFVVLHTCCHNPTGEDLSADQWKALFLLMKERGLSPIFDFAYHGYAASIAEDRAPILACLDFGIEFIVCYSLSKSLTLYGERVGAFFAVCGSKEAKDKVLSQAKALVRQNYSSPPLHGTQIVTKVVSTQELRSSWEQELSEVKERLKKMRRLFSKKMQERLSSHIIDYVEAQNGLFSLIGLRADQVLELRDRFAIFMPENGRINFAGLNEHNIDYTVESICRVLERDKR